MGTSNTRIHPVLPIYLSAATSGTTRRRHFVEVDGTIDELDLTAWTTVARVQPSFDIRLRNLRFHAVATLVCYNSTSLEIQLDQAPGSFSIVGQQIGFHVPELFGWWVDLTATLNDGVKRAINSTIIRPPS